MLKIKEAIVVEGNYDKIKLSGIVDATIVVTDGFMIFKNKSMMRMLSALADKKGIIVFTDSDRAGFQIRNYIKNVLHGKNVKHAYIPDIKGKERRKDKPSKEGFLGVEGVSNEIIIDALKNAATPEIDSGENKRRITKSDLCIDGFSGLADSHIKRTGFLKSLGLPVRMSSNMMLECLNAIYGYDEYKRLAVQYNRKKQD
ncbi:MAG: DUF4093 domain-containing protein [Ruminococcaceae bacterium]|nr:DUF4093 domain-containing protein [Oscillospiraceae bacterium]